MGSCCSACALMGEGAVCTGPNCNKGQRGYSPVSGAFGRTSFGQRSAGGPAGGGMQRPAGVVEEPLAKPTPSTSSQDALAGLTAALTAGTTIATTAMAGEQQRAQRDADARLAQIREEGQTERARIAAEAGRAPVPDLSKGGAAPTSGAIPPVPEPWYKSPPVLIAGTALLASGGYVAWQALRKKGRR